MLCTLAGLAFNAASRTSKETKQPLYCSGGSGIDTCAGIKCFRLLAIGFAKAVYLKPNDTRFDHAIHTYASACDTVSAA